MIRVIAELEPPLTWPVVITIPVRLKNSEITIFRDGRFLNTIHEIKTTITGKQYHITIAKPVSIVSIARKYVNDTVVMPSVPIKNISRISFNGGNGSLRIEI